MVLWVYNMEAQLFYELDNDDKYNEYLNKFDLLVLPGEMLNP